MANIRYEIPEEKPQMVSETPTDYGITIPVTVPTMGGKDEILIKSLSQLNPALQELCGICHVDEADLNGDVARSQILEGV